MGSDKPREGGGVWPRAKSKARRGGLKGRPDNAEVRRDAGRALEKVTTRVGAQAGGFGLCLSFRLERFLCGSPAWPERQAEMSRDWWRVSSVKTTTGDRIGRSPVGKGLLAEAELLEDLVVLVEIFALEVIKQLATAGGHLQEAAAGVEVLAVFAEVIGQVIDPGREQRDLDFARTGIGFVRFELGDDFGFNRSGNDGWLS